MCSLTSGSLPRKVIRNPTTGICSLGKHPQYRCLKMRSRKKVSAFPGNQLTLATCDYINEAQPIQTMADELTENGLTWKYYDAPLPKGYTLDQGIVGCPSCNVYDYWSPLRAQNRTWTNPVHFDSMVAREQFLWDVGNGTLPDVSWVIPSAADLRSPAS